MIVDDFEYVDEPLLVLPKQREMITYREKWGASRGGQRAGKTTAWVYWLLFERMEPYPEANAVCVGATYQQLREGIFGTLQDMLWKHGYEDGKDFHYRGSPRPWLSLSNGAKLHSWSAEIVARVRSANVQTLVCEEPQTWGPQAVAAWESLSGRLTHNERTAALYPDLMPQGRMSFNPSGVGPGHWLYEMLEKRWPEEGWRCWQLSVRENTILQKADPTYIRNLEISIQPERHAVEIDGDYSTMGGGVYRRYDYGMHHAPPDGMPVLAPDEHKPLLWSLDFNVGLMCSEIAQAHLQRVVSETVIDSNGRPKSMRRKAIQAWQERVFYFIDEMALPDAGVEDLVPHLFSMNGGLYKEIAMRNGMLVYGDPSGGNRNQIISGNNPIKTNWMRIWADLKAAGLRHSSSVAPGCFTIRVVSGAVHPIDHVNMVNMQLNAGPGPEPQMGYGMVIDEARCPEVLLDFRMVTYVPGTNKVEKKTAPPAAARRTHAADAAGYLCFPERAMMFEKRRFEWQMDR